MAGKTSSGKPVVHSAKDGASDQESKAKEQLAGQSHQEPNATNPPIGKDSGKSKESGPPSSIAVATANWTEPLPSEHVGDLAHFGAGRLFQQMAFHLRQADRFFVDAYFLSQRLDAAEITNAPTDIIRQLKKKWISLGDKEFAIAESLFQKIRQGINRFSLSFEEREELRTDLSDPWECLFPATPADEWLDILDEDGNASLEDWGFELRLQAVRSALVRHNTDHQDTLFKAGEIFEAGRCRSDVGQLLLPNADRKRWAADQIAKPAQLLAESCTISEQEENVDQAPLSFDELERKVQPRTRREVGELQPQSDWHLTFDNILRELKALLGTDLTLAGSADWSSQQSLDRSLRRVNDKIVNRLMKAVAPDRAGDDDSGSASTAATTTDIDGTNTDTNSTTQNERRSWPPKVEERNKWIYGRETETNPLPRSKTRIELQAKIAEQKQQQIDVWAPVSSDNGIKDIAIEYAKRHELPHPNQRKRGRLRKQP